MSIMPFAEWMNMTKRGVVKPRSPELRELDMALENYGSKKDKAGFDALDAALQNWLSGKEDPLKSIRNSTGAVTKLLDQINQKKKSDAASAASAAALRAADAKAKTDTDAARRDIGRMNRPAGFLDEVRGGAGKFSKGELSGKFDKAGLATITEDPRSKNVRYEGFAGADLERVKQGWADAKTAAYNATQTLSWASMSFSDKNGREHKRIKTWFGDSSKEEIEELLEKARKVESAMRDRPITFVLRRNLTWHIIDNTDPLGAMRDETLSSGTYGFVYGAGNHTGEGMRVILCDRFMTKPCQYEGPAQTIYHELTHKILGTKDTSTAGVTTYGVIDCKELAKKDPASARNVADNWGYFAIAGQKQL